MNPQPLSIEAISDLYHLVFQKLTGKITKEQYDSEVQHVAADELRRTERKVTVTFVKDGR
jgi:hypothetical protein